MDATATGARPRPPVLAVGLHINGQPHPVAIEPRRPLLDVLRCDLGLTGTKEVCEMGNCGACTVLLDGEPVYSCLVLAVECGDHTIETVEGLARGQALSPVQQAFVDCDALQCGFCTPGQVLTLEALFRRRPDATDDEIAAAVTGNLCRCGAYRHIIDAGVQARHTLARSGPPATGPGRVGALDQADRDGEG